MVFPNELLCCTLIFFWQWICTFLFSHMDIHQLTIHHDKVEYTFFVAMKHMNVYRPLVPVLFVLFDQFVGQGFKVCDGFVLDD